MPLYFQCSSSLRGRSLKEEEGKTGRARKPANWALLAESTDVDMLCGILGSLQKLWILSFCCLSVEMDFQG